MRVKRCLDITEVILEENSLLCNTSKIIELTADQIAGPASLPCKAHIGQFAQSPSSPP